MENTSNNLSNNLRQISNNLKANQGVVGWLFRNLFSSPTNAFLSIVAIWLVYRVIGYFADWAILNATWVGTSAADCDDTQGACWVFVKENFLFIMFGFFPQEYVWRPTLVGVIALALITPIFIRTLPIRYRMFLGGFVLSIFPFIAFAIIHGSILGIQIFDPIISTEQWGGFLLTLVLASVGMVASLPIGIILALGRRSQSMPIVRTICVIFIEFWRGVPLITILFMASVMLPLFFPEGTNFDKLLRALIGLTLFQSAYMAEVVRGGLQAIDKGQYEAADSMGLTYWKSMIFIILPQALKLVIPGIVNTLIALFKDTSLVYIIGMWDLLHSAYGATRDPEWLRFSIEAFAYASLLFWLCCFLMSRYSQGLEKRLAEAERK